MPEVFTTKGGQLDFTSRARAMVFESVKKRLENTGSEFAFTEDDVTVFWFSKDAKGWTALLNTTLPDNIYYRVIHDAVAKVTSFDVYHKFVSQTFSDQESY